jgi:hypothetical protein
MRRRRCLVAVAVAVAMLGAAGCAKGGSAFERKHDCFARSHFDEVIEGVAITGCVLAHPLRVDGLLCRAGADDVDVLGRAAWYDSGQLAACYQLTTAVIDGIELPAGTAVRLDQASTALQLVVMDGKSALGLPGQPSCADARREGAAWKCRRFRDQPPPAGQAPSKLSMIISKVSGDLDEDQATRTIARAVGPMSQCQGGHAPLGTITFEVTYAHPARPHVTTVEGSLDGPGDPTACLTRALADIDQPGAGVMRVRLFFSP